MRLVRPLQRIGLKRTNRGLPILMYHSVSADPEMGVSPYYRVATSVERFAEQMRLLAEKGYRGVSLSQGLAALAGTHQSGTGASTEKLVAITFDDGFRDFHTEAYSVLAQHKFTATMYIPTAFIGDRRKSFKSRECLTWNEVLELDHAGMEFGSHTVNHPKLLDLSWNEIEQEISESKVEIENRLSHSISSFAYPYAFPQANRAFAVRLQGLLQKYSYSSCVTTAVGTSDQQSSLLELPRLPVNSLDSRSFFHAKLDGCYDWVGTLQFLRKKLRSKV
jgi:peptidoglycan/xylan/chitin deacetylase (PgdA/CDA1 family)